MKLSRRLFLESAVLGGAFVGLTSRYDLFKKGVDISLQNSYGEISPMASANTGEFLLSLPKGFQYNVFSNTGTPMSNGQPTPKLCDGMACFDSGNTWTIIKNHEISDFVGVANTVSGTKPYDAFAGGGTTTLTIDKQTKLPINQYVSLSGTLRNCGGGITPWKTWISCEETLAGTNAGFQKPHGFCFEVSSNSPNNSPVALTAMGRFNHEAIAIDRKGLVYLTEDINPNSGFYRFVPNQIGQLSLGGKLQMLAIRNQSNYDTRINQTVQIPLLATWIDIPNPNPIDAETNVSAVFNQGLANGGAVFTRLEGCFSFFDRIYFTATNGGNAGLGQVWEYRHRKGTNGILKLIYESPKANVLDFPDNLCFGNNADIYICEDGSNGNFMRILKTNGTLSTFAQNIVPNFETYEITGSVFSPDKQVLFFNIQTPGITFAVWGNW